MSKKFIWYGGLCNSCSNTNEPYMVTETVWNKIVTNKEKKLSEVFICLRCLEQRLNRKLKKQDFIKAPINEGIFGFHWKHWVNRKDYNDFIDRIIKGEK